MTLCDRAYADTRSMEAASAGRLLLVWADLCRCRQVQADHRWCGQTAKRESLLEPENKENTTREVMKFQIKINKHEILMEERGRRDRTPWAAGGLTYRLDLPVTHCDRFIPNSSRHGGHPANPAPIVHESVIDRGDFAWFVQGF